MTEHVVHASPAVPTAEAERAFAPAAVRALLKRELLGVPLLPVLHASPRRLRLLGLLLLLGHLLYGWLWTRVLPQPYEDLGLRACAAALGLLLLGNRIADAPGSRLSGLVFCLVVWVDLPLICTWLYLCNGSSPIWLAQLSLAVIVCFLLTDWRLAAVGTLTGAAAAFALFTLLVPEAPAPEAARLWSDGVVLLSCWTVGTLVGVPSTKLCRQQLFNVRAAVGVMAHELRTPLATMALLGDALKSSTPACSPEATLRIEQLAAKLHQLVRNMNRQIDIQIANARLDQPPRLRESLRASELVHEALAQYPYRSSRERDVVQLQVHRDFEFRGSRVHFHQLVDNLIKNAFRSLAAAGIARRGDLVIEIDVIGGRGRMAFIDQGVGIEPALQERIFEPFFSTHREAGHGLGLAFCRGVVQACGGTLSVRSEPWRGAVFTVDVPLRTRTPAAAVR